MPNHAGMAKTWTREMQKTIVFLEVYSGTATMSRVWQHLLPGCQVETIDMEPDWHPTLQYMLPRDVDTVVETLQSRYPRHQFVVHGSPPCDQYSKANTTGRRDLETADAQVQAVLDIADRLDAVFVLIENPWTGLLKDRDVIASMPYRFRVDYCKYGKLYRKSTMFWCSHDLVALGFHPQECKGDCHAMRPNRKQHVMTVQDAPYGESISIPEALVASLLRTILSALPSLMRPLPAEPARRRKDDHFEVNTVLDCRVRGGEIEVLVCWKNWDGEEWIPLDNLDADFRSYDFLEARVLRRLEKLVENPPAARRDSELSCSTVFVDPPSDIVIRRCCRAAGSYATVEAAMGFLVAARPHTRIVIDLRSCV